jgi:hypothetical protein
MIESGGIGAKARARDWSLQSLFATVWLVSSGDGPDSRLSAGSKAIGMKAHADRKKTHSGNYQ